MILEKSIAFQNAKNNLESILKCYQYHNLSVNDNTEIQISPEGTVLRGISLARWYNENPGKKYGTHVEYINIGESRTGNGLEFFSKLVLYHENCGSIVLWFCGDKIYNISGYWIPWNVITQWFPSCDVPQILD